MTVAEPKTRRWTREDYYRMADAGIFQDRHVQLIEGEIIEMAPQKDRHAYAITLIDSALRKTFAGDFTIRIQLPMRLSDHSEPEPDLAVIAGSVRKNPTHPSTALLVVEVADSTLVFDRDRKAPLYAAAGVGEYWILNLSDRCVEIHRNPFRDSSGAWRYRDIHMAVAEETLSPLAAPQSHIAVVDLLP